MTDDGEEFAVVRELKEGDFHLLEIIDLVRNYQVSCGQEDSQILSTKKVI